MKKLILFSILHIVLLQTINSTPNLLATYEENKQKIFQIIKEHSRKYSQKLPKNYNQFIKDLNGLTKFKMTQIPISQLNNLKSKYGLPQELVNQLSNIKYSDKQIYNDVKFHILKSHSVLESIFGIAKREQNNEIFFAYIRGKTTGQLITQYITVSLRKCKRRWFRKKCWNENVNKPRGMVVHPAPGHQNGTLVNAIMFHCKNNLSGINGVIRPGIVHRIDKDTSGVLCICKNDFSHNNISKQFQEHTNIRKYVAIVKGLIKDDAGTIDNFLNRDKKNRLRMAVCDIGKRAITKYKIIERFKNHTYIECELLTGRTHQIRAHMRHIGHPLLGDLLYGGFDDKFKNLDGQILHAKFLEISHPKTNERISFTAEIPEYFREILNKIKKI